MRIKAAGMALACALLTEGACVPVYAAEAVSTGTVVAGSSGQRNEQSSEASAQCAASGTGWKKNGGGWTYYGEDGTAQHGGFTPDGYLLDDAGNWSQSAVRILDESILLPDRFVTSSQMGSWSSIQPDLERVGKRIQTALGTARVIQFGDESVVYRNASSDGTLLRIDRDERTDGYQFEISVNLGNRKDGISKASTYDYAMFYLLLAKISHTPDALANAIYGSWQGNNPYNLEENKETQVGDAILSYRVKQGAGVYLIRSAFHSNQ